MAQEEIIKNRNSFEFWEQQVTNGQRFQETFARSTDWPRFKAYYRHQFGQYGGTYGFSNQYARGGAQRNAIIPINYVFAHIRSLVPQVYFKNPRVSVTPRKPSFATQAKLLEKSLNYLIRHLKVKDELKKMIVDSSLTGIANGIVGYDSQFGFDPALIQPEIKGVATLSSFDDRGDRIEYDNTISPGNPWFLRTRPEDVVYPFGCANAKDAEWVAIRHIRPLKDLKKDKKYTGTSKIQGDYQITRTGPNHKKEVGVNDFENTTVEYVELWEIRDYKTRTVKSYVTGHDKLIRNEPDTLQISGLPVKTLVFNEDPDFIYGISDVRIIEPQQLEANANRTLLNYHANLSVIKFIVAQDALKPEEIDKILSGRAVVVKADGDNIGDIIRDVNHAIPESLLIQGQQIENDLRTMLGFSRNQTGEFQGKTHISATETRTVSANSFIRVDERRDAVADLLTDVARDFAQMIFKYWDQPKIADIVGEDGARLWVQFTGAELEGEYDYSIDPNEAKNISPESRKQDSMELMQIWGALHPGTPPPEELERYFYSQFEGIDMDVILTQVQQRAQQQAAAQQAGQSPGNPVKLSSTGNPGQGGQ